MSQMAASVESRGMNLMQSLLFLKACSSGGGGEKETRLSLSWGPSLTYQVRLRKDVRVSTVSWMGMKPTGRVSLMSISFMSTRTLPKWLCGKRNGRRRPHAPGRPGRPSDARQHPPLLGRDGGLTFSLEKTLVKHRYRVTLDLKSPSFQRSASRPSVVVDTWRRLRPESSGRRAPSPPRQHPTLNGVQLFPRRPRTPAASYHIVSGGGPVPGGDNSDPGDGVHGHLGQSFGQLSDLRHVGGGLERRDRHRGKAHGPTFRIPPNPANTRLQKEKESARRWLKAGASSPALHEDESQQIGPEQTAFAISIG